MKPSRRSHAISLAFTGACFVVTGIGIGTYWSTHRLERSFDSVAESHQAIEKLQAIEFLIETGETSVYNYVVTGREERLTPYLRAKRQLPQKLHEVALLVQGHPRQKSALRQFSSVYAVHQQYLSKIVTARETEGFDAAAQWVAAEDDHYIRDVLNHLLDEVRSDQAKVLKRRSASSSDRSTDIKRALTLASLLSFGLIGWVFAMLRREAGVRRVAESTNRRLESFLNSIVDRIPYMVTVKEAETLRITLVNKAAVEWLGRSESELIGSNDYDLRPAEAARLGLEQDRGVLQLGEPVDIPEEILVHEGKEERILHTQKVAIPDDAGVPAYLLTISEDITQRKQEQKMVELSRDAAVLSERLKSEFMRNMSHEIRTPLTVVLGMTSILMESNLTPEQRELAARADRAANGLARLCKSILDFSKIENGTFVLESQEIHLRQIIESILTMLQEKAKAKGIRLVSLVPPSVPQILIGDPIRLREVLTELIGNALKFTERGEIAVRVIEAEHSGDPYTLTLKITDTGPGIAENVQKHLFEPFRQGDGSPTRRFGGTGLGLAISKRIVELMGGKIGFSSALNEGSSFWITLPFRKLSSGAPVAPVSLAPEVLPAAEPQHKSAA